ncbi:methyltransferase family protein [Streptomyces paludis]|uniref:Isoprenylcysteine carboxylmethyltransferase family protein n=1 Tax=Streptomyces paludis TaxID=2282738 RepID=A0A345HT43_9ACTN|nr:isoprenylcysteine carboxylmethyltransferase family protein [Streptomyces paludis]AXG79867.1 isoprenylcysteine carboxylmethyltransferase family protein [Streptomyces paludis]
MDNSVLVLLLLDFALITALPRVFFKRTGTFNLRWWSTALPVGLTPLLVLLRTVLDLPPLLDESVLSVTGPIAAVLFAGSIGLIALTLGTHRVPIALWHQTNDDPVHIVTWGAYARIRHPFYTAFLLAFTGVVLAYPHWLTLVPLVYMAAMLTRLAVREEQKLSASEFGAEYQEYMTRTGRFVPSLSRSAARQEATS